VSDDEPERYRLRVAGAAAKALAETLPEKVATAAYEFITGPLLRDPRRSGKPLEEPLAPLWSARRGTYRVPYRIDDRRRLVEVVAIRHRADAYHS
jgi:mRNA interferase RelE/StbE